MNAYEELGEALRKQRVLFFALTGLEGTGALTEDERIGLFEMAGDIANQLEEVQKILEKEDSETCPVSVPPAALPGPESENVIELIYKDNTATVTRRLSESDTIDEVVRQVVFLLQGATYSQDQILRAFAQNINEMGVPK